jgi:hypothetical protein
MKKSLMQWNVGFFICLSLLLVNLLGCTTISAEELDIAVCDPARGQFSPEITNPYFPYSDGKTRTLEGGNEKVEMKMLPQTETVAGVVTSILEERESKNGILVEVSRNYHVQASDGTVCYFGEAVDDYDRNGNISGHSGAWRADEGQNKPGIIMPAQPTVGQAYKQEVAPGVAEDKAEHVSIEQTFVTPAGTFQNVLLGQERPPSTKRYHPGTGLIFDDGMVLTKIE